MKIGEISIEAKNQRIAHKKMRQTIKIGIITITKKSYQIIIITTKTIIMLVLITNQMLLINNITPFINKSLSRCILSLDKILCSSRINNIPTKDLVLIHKTKHSIRAFSTTHKITTNNKLIPTRLKIFCKLFLTILSINNNKRTITTMQTFPINRLPPNSSVFMIVSCAV